MDYVVNVPVPTNAPQYVKYPFADMPVGASFLLPRSERLKVSGAAANWKKRHPGWDYTSRTSEEGLRFWRTA
jgi:hypothetical protein